MPLIKSISGIRGTIGGVVGDALTPPDLLKFTAAYAHWVISSAQKSRCKVVVGRDARLSGIMVSKLVNATLQSNGVDVIDAGLATTPTVEMAVCWEGADGGIVLSASHNPREWNALKLLNSSGEFLQTKDAATLLSIAEREDFCYVPVDQLGQYIKKDYTQQHIDAVIGHPLVDVEAIYRCGYKAVVDGVNSVGGIIIPKLLENLGVTCIPLFCEPTGDFAHNPEPLPQHLTELSKRVVLEKADLGFAVDPDVDRLSIVCEDGSFFGEEFTLVAIADYVLGIRKGDVVSNLASSRALSDLAHQYGVTRYASAVGEAHVVKEMKQRNAVVGGEGNGGVIIPDLHYGRDALIGIALFLTHLAKKKISCSQLKKHYPLYFMAKERVELSTDFDQPAVFARIKEHFKSQTISEADGIKVDFESDKSWIIVRASNTEPILRIYAEAPTLEEVQALAQEVKRLIIS
ncbi:MAG: phosphoglucosamine mutase [Prevotellaceae bacterium]|jgi:phosphomannomutase|nr:phosphoglucosamine mutase [Prevotellaceae bacterium]